MIVSKNEPATVTAAKSAPITKAKASPISISLAASTARSPGPVGRRWPCTRTGVRPMASATAAIPRTRAGISRLLNNGASTNRGLTRASTRMNPTSCCSPNCWRRRSTATSASADDVRDAAPEVRRVGEQLVEHPWAEQQQHRRERDDLRDEGERLLLDLGDRLEDRHHEAHDEAGGEHRHGDLEGQRQRVGGEVDDDVLVHVSGSSPRAIG